MRERGRFALQFHRREIKQKKHPIISRQNWQLNCQANKDTIGDALIDKGRAVLPKTGSERDRLTLHTKAQFSVIFLHISLKTEMKILFLASKNHDDFKRLKEFSPGSLTSRRCGDILGNFSGCFQPTRVFLYLLGFY